MLKINDRIRLQLLTKLLEQEMGYEEAHKFIDRAEMEYAIIETNKVLERR